jgi:uncharacterized protein
VKILAVSDQVAPILYSSSVRESFPDIDLLIGCGDLPFYFLEYLVSSLDVPLLYVLGNHDTTPQYTLGGGMLKEVGGGTNMHGRTIRDRALIFAGLEGSMRYRPNAPLMYSEAEMRWEIARLMPQLLWNQVKYGRAVDVLITHSPPFRVHDGEDLTHTGFKMFHTLLRRFRPRYMLHGHVHIYRRDVPRVTRLYDTLLINVYPFRVLDFFRPPRPDQVIGEGDIQL